MRGERENRLQDVQRHGRNVAHVADSLCHCAHAIAHLSVILHKEANMSWRLDCLLLTQDAP